MCGGGDGWRFSSRETGRLQAVASRLTDHDQRSNEAVTLARDGLYEAWLLGVIPERLPNLADGGVDAVLGVEKNVLAPDPFDDLIAGNQLTVPLHQEGEEVHGNLFELEDVVSPAQLITTAVEFEFREARDPRFHAPIPPLGGVKL